MYLDDLKLSPIIVISGPSGCGKSSLLKILFSKIDNYYFSISSTSRVPRIGETHGVEYFFISKDEFEEDIKNGEFLEFAKVHENYYGTSLKPVKQALECGKIVIFDIDVQGHRIIRDKLGNITTSVFITTPSLVTLEQRLTNRQTDSSDIIQKRLHNAKQEIHEFDKYDFFIVNDNLEIAASKLLSVIEVAKLKATLYQKDTLINTWLN